MDDYILWMHKNSEHLSWKPDLCQLTPKNPNYNATLCNLKTNQPQTPSSHVQKSQSQLEKAHKFFEKFESFNKASDIPFSDIPDSFDLRNISGVDYSG